MHTRTVVTALALACAPSCGAGRATRGADTMAATAAPRLERFEHFDAFRRWTRVNDELIWSPTHGARGMYVRVYVNDVGRAAAARRAGPFPVGSVLVKELFEAEGDRAARAPLVYTAMVKRPPGTAPDTGDWEWLIVDSAGRVTARSAQRPDCSNCHARAPTGDFVFAIPDGEHP